MPRMFLDRWMKKNPGRSPVRFAFYNFSLFVFTPVLTVLLLHRTHQTSLRSSFIQGIPVLWLVIAPLALLLPGVVERIRKRIISQFGPSVTIPVPVDELYWKDRWVLWNIVFGILAGISLQAGFDVVHRIMHVNLIFSAIMAFVMAYGTWAMTALIVEQVSELIFCRRVLKYYATPYRIKSVGRPPQAKRANPSRNAGNVSAMPATSVSQRSRSGWSRWMRRERKAGPKVDPKFKPTSGPNSES
jgi:hypothetical protein